jgi:signal transduction histidine kinase
MTLTEHEASGTAGVPRARWRAPDTLLENLQLIADGVVAMAGFAVAAIRIRRGDDLELVVDTDAHDAIGTRIPVQLMLDELALAEDWGLLQFVPHGVGDTSSGSWVVPRGLAVSDAPDAWHPMDMLVAPLYDGRGVLRGTLAIDEPLDGRLPDLERRRVLEKFAVLAARAVLASVERESLAEQVAMADTVKAIVRTTSAQLSLAGLLEASEHTLLEGFAAQRLWIKTVADDGEAASDYLPGDFSLALPAEVVAFAESSAAYCWRHQVVMKIGTQYPVPPKMSDHHFQQVVDLLHGIAMSSMVFVPLGAGPECMGSLVLMRSDPDREWTDIECAALLDIGHDLGRAALNARTFDREHALVTELQALDNYKSQLIATVSHELKSPLTTVAGHLEMLESGTVSIGEQARASLAAIGRASDRMTRVIEDLLLLRKVGDVHKPLRLDPVDLGELVRDAVALTALAAAEKDLQVQIELRGPTVQALGEPDELDKVVHNLVSNAVKYTPAGGWVQITAESREGEAVLTIRDTGIGISPEDQQHLFEEFFRSSNPVAVALPGTGLGLAIVRRIVERHGGHIDLESAPGVGSTFSVTLPASASVRAG